MIELVVFLGNPGNEYRRTRHNAARLLLEAMPGSSAYHWQDKFGRGRSGALWCQEEFAGRQVHLLQPLSFMNRSGESVLAACSFYKIKPGNVLVVHDEIELPFGTISFRKAGGSGGHNGLRSVAALLGTPGYFRFRLGVGRPGSRRAESDGDPGSGDRQSVASYVLSRFSPEEEAVLPKYLESAAVLLVRTLESSPKDLETSLRRIDLFSGE